MPIYSFKCSKCGNIKDVLKKVEESDRPAACDECNGSMRKTFNHSGTSFILKGPGWFKKDGKY